MAVEDAREQLGADATPGIGNHDHNSGGLIV